MGSGQTWAPLEIGRLLRLLTLKVTSASVHLRVAESEISFSAKIELSNAKTPTNHYPNRSVLNGHPTPLLPWCSSVNWWHDQSHPSFRRLRPYFGIPGTAVRQSSRPCAWRCPIHVIYGDFKQEKSRSKQCTLWITGILTNKHGNLGILIELNQTNLVYRSTCFNRFFSTLKQ